MNIHQSKPDGAGKFERLLNETEVASWIGVTRACLQNWRLKGEGPPYLAVGRLRKYRASDVLKWLEKCRCTTSTDEAVQ